MSKKNAAKYKRRRERLWLADPKCRSCGVVTILPKDMEQPTKNTDKELLYRMATLDHVFPRIHELRVRGGRGETRLLCYKCNNKLSKVQSFGKFGSEEFKKTVEEMFGEHECHSRCGCPTGESREE